MRDFKAFVREQIVPHALAQDREDKIVGEWAAQIEETYDALREDGASDEEAWREIERQVPDWRVLGAELLDAEPLVTRLADPRRGPLAGASKKTLVAALRENLGTGILRDVRGAFRLLAKDRKFSVAVIATLAVCLGANAAVFTVVNSVLLQPLPVPDADRIVAMGDVYPSITPDEILSNDAPSYFDRLEALTTLEEQAAFSFWYDTITIDDVAEEVRGMRATPSLFQVLRVPPLLGRTFTEDEGEVGADRKVILSHRLWQRLYGGDESVIGDDLRLGWTGQPYTIVGVMPPGFTAFDRGYDGHASTSGYRAQFWIPLTFSPEQRSDAARTRYGLFHIGRLAQGATVEQVRSQLDTLNAANFERFPELGLAELGMYTAATPLKQALTRDIRGVLYLLWGAAGFVLLIGAINIANLALARASARARELATRFALGAGTAQAVRQLIVEGLVPALIGGAAGAAIGAAILELLAADAIQNLPNAAHVRMDGVVIGVVLALSGLVGVLIGLVPAVKLGGLTLNSHLTQAGRSSTAGRAARLSRHGLVVMQTALSVMLLVGAALLLTSFRHLLNVDAGFTAANVTTGTVFPPPSRYPDQQAVVDLSNRILEAVRAIPGVEAAGMTSNIALSGQSSPATVFPADRALPTGELVLPSVVSVTPGYFEAMATPLVRGRLFAESDRHSAQLVAVVDERLAARLWPSEDPIGKQLHRGGSAHEYMVVGVVGEVRFEGVAAPAESIGAVYFPEAQAPPLGRLRWLAIRTAGPQAGTIGAVREALYDIDAGLPLADVQTMAERMSQSLASERLAARLASTFGLVAMFLSMLGIYSVLAYTVAQRRRELGIRMALGNTVRGVFRLVFKEGCALIAFGLVLGLAGAVALGRVLEAELAGVDATDPVILATVGVGAACVTLLACVGPALRAARVDPVEELQR